MNRTNINQYHPAGVLFIVGLAALVVSGCNNVERGVGRSLDNANSVVTHESPKLWGKGETPASQRQRPGAPATRPSSPSEQSPTQ